MDVILKHQALDWKNGYQGEYLLTNPQNGKPAWTLMSNKKTIWFDPGNNEWIIGDLDDFGGNSIKISSNGGQGYLDPFQIPADKWKFWQKLQFHEKKND